MKRARVRLALISLALAACSAGKPRLTTEGREWFPLHPRTREPALAAVVLTGGSGYGRVAGEDRPLAIAVWADGTLVWSGAPEGGYGHPYRIAKLGPQRGEELARQIEQLMLGREGKRSAFNIPDASHEVIAVREGQRAWKMSSCIDLFEAEPNLVAFAGGVGARDQVPAGRENTPEELELKDFRFAWGLAKVVLLTAIPYLSEDAQFSGFGYAAVGTDPN